MTDFNDFVKSVLEVVEKVGSSFTKPDDDWLPVLLMDCDNKRLVADLHFTQEDKDRLPSAIKTTFRHHLPDQAAMVNPAWMLEIHSNDPLAQISIEINTALGICNHPQRKETLIVECADREGHGDTWMVDIIRSPSEPPTLGKWIKTDAVSGRFAGLLQAAFQSCSKMRRRNKK